MKTRVSRMTVDLGQFPDLIVIYLGMRVNTLRGLRTLISIGPRIARAVAEKPPGLLLHENFLFSLLPPHVGFRQYWRDFESLENWARSLPHQGWWKEFLRDSGGAGFWHETYRMRGGIEAVYDDLPVPIGLMNFAPIMPARGALFSARQRLHHEGAPGVDAPVSESEIYGGEGDPMP